MTEEYDWTYEDHRRRQVRRGLELTPAERLLWLETTVDELRPLVGLAARPRAAENREDVPDTGSTGKTP